MNESIIIAVITSIVTGAMLALVAVPLLKRDIKHLAEEMAEVKKWIIELTSNVNKKLMELEKKVTDYHEEYLKDRIEDHKQMIENLKK